MQFFDEETFKNFLGDYDLTTITLTVTDTYNEEAISHSIESLDKDVCLGIALQLAIVGYGNKKFNSVTVNGKQIDILEYMRNNGIKFDGRLNDKLKPGDLTPRRLIRFFRFATREYLMKNPHVQSYLFKKYAPLRSPSERITIFPGFEHLAERGTDDNAVEVLVRTYAQLDARLKTNVKERIVRVLSARGFSYDRLITLQI